MLFISKHPYLVLPSHGIKLVQFTFDDVIEGAPHQAKLREDGALIVYVDMPKQLSRCYAYHYGYYSVLGVVMKLL